MGQTRAGAGVSRKADTKAAVDEAFDQAAAALGGRAPRFGFIFTAFSQATRGALIAARARAPEAAFLAATAAGEFTGQGLVRDGVCMLLVSGDDFIWEAAFARDLDSNLATAAAQLCAGFNPASKRAVARKMAHSTSVVLVDGLSPSFEGLVSELRRLTRAHQQIVGGGAGDDFMKSTRCGMGLEAASDAAAAIHVFSSNPWGIGVDHGVAPATPRMRVTRAHANVVLEIDGRPALDTYRAYAEHIGVDPARASTSDFLVQHELGVFFENLVKVRAPVGVTPDGGLVLAGAVPEGTPVCIVTGSESDLIAAANRAAKEAKDSLHGPAAGVLVFDCVCRGMRLGDNFQAEIDAIQSHFPGVPIAGMLSFGEVARFKGKLDGFHNNTVVVAAIPE